MRNDAVIIQTCFSARNDAISTQTGIFYDMLRLAFPRHSAYARAHNLDYWNLMSDIYTHGSTLGGWPKIGLILDALKQGYEYVAYLDTDAAVWNMECDLRDALPAGKLIGACVHDPAKSEYLRMCQVPKHMNVGVLYIRNDPRTVEFMQAWDATHPGHPRWLEQGSFNEMAQSGQWSDIVAVVDDTWNATVNVNPVPNPNVLAWHGVTPNARRLALMQAAMANDHLRFRI